MLKLLLLAVMPTAFALNPVVGRALAEQIEPAQLTAVRWLVAGLLVCGFAYWRGKAECWMPGRIGWTRTLILGAFGMGLCSYCAYASTQTGSATNVSLIYSATTALVVLGEIVARQTRPRPILIAGVALCICGAVTVIARGDLGHLLEVDIGAGDLWAVLGMVSWAGYTLAMKHIKSDLTPLTQLGIMSLAGAAAAAPVALMETMSVGPPLMDLRAFIWIAVLVLIASVGSYLSYNVALTRAGPILTSAALTLTPLYAAGLAVVLVSEQLGWFHVAGGALVIAGLVLINQQRSRSG